MSHVTSIQKGKTKIELVSAYEIMQSFKPKTYTTPQTLAKVTISKEVFYIMPYGEDYECEGGHHCEVLTSEEFNQMFSTELIK